SYSDSMMCLISIPPFDYLKQVQQKKLGNILLFTDRALSHRSKKVYEYLEENKDYLRIIYLPKGSLEFNAVEECWRHGKYMIY
ncbi:MAG: transposase, partial [Candidatus Nitrosocosmicus sp.]